MKSTLAAEKTARVHWVFGASNYVNRADKYEKFSGNSSIFNWKKPQDIQLGESQILWKLKALEVFLKFHIHMHYSVH